MPRIGVNALYLIPGGVGGTEIYLRELLAALLTRAGGECRLLAACQLSAPHRRVFRLRFGLDGGPQKTLEEVGQKFGVTRERVRQIQNIALKKLRKMIEKMETTKT